MQVARLVVKFTKLKGAKFISHLDTMRTLHRAFRRAALPISYSKGFNPHASISVAAPLSLGIASIAEYADVDIDMDMEPSVIMKELNEALPMDIKITDIIKIEGKMPAAMAAVSCVKYSIAFEYNGDLDYAKKTVEKILASEDITRLKRTKSGEKLVNIRPLIISLGVYENSNGLLSFTCLLKAGSNGSLGADAVAGLIKEFSEGEVSGHPAITREEIYTEIDNKKIPLDRYFSRM